ncbi:hypothetical protein ACET3Z_031067 [Daucus carota]
MPIDLRFNLGTPDENEPNIEDFNFKGLASAICSYKQIEVQWAYTSISVSNLIYTLFPEARDKLERVLQCLDKGRCDALQDCIVLLPYSDVTQLHTPSTSTYLSHLSPHYASLSLSGQVNKHPMSPLFTSPSARSL